MTIHYNDKKVTMTLPKGTGNVTKTLKKGRFYEQRCLTYIMKLGAQGIYIDVGANIGNHAIFFGLFTDATKIIALEPNPSIYDLLVSNIKANKLERKVKALNAAAGDKDGKCSIIIDPKDEIGGSRVKKGGNIDQFKLDGIVKDKVGLIKIDVEGYEKYVILGAEEILEKYKPELFIEITNKKQYADIYTIISKYGYSPIATYNNTATYHFSTTKKTPVSHYISKLYPIRRVIRSS